MAQTALVTGANKGIGFEIARLLGERGITAIIGARHLDRGRAAAGRLGLPFVQLDVTDPASVQAAATWVDQEYGTLDILVNNAGINAPEPDRRPGGTSLEALRRVYETNLFGVVTVTNAMLPLLRRASSWLPWRGPGSRFLDCLEEQLRGTRSRRLRLDTRRDLIEARRLYDRHVTGK